MFDVASSEVILLGVVALLVIPPKDLPKAMRFAGHWVGKVRGVANQFRSGFDTMVREAELQDMEKKWAAENERIMREHPPEPVQMLPLAEPSETLREHDHIGGEHDAAAQSAGDHDGGDTAPVMVEQPVVTKAPGAVHTAVPAAMDTAVPAEPEAKALS